MVLFQPPSGPPDPWDVGEYQWASLLLWIVCIVGIIWGFLLIVSYINTRKRHYLLWGASFSLIFIGFHQVIGTSDYGILLDGFMAAMLAFIPGLLAAGLLMAAYKDKKFGDYYALFALIMAILIGIFKFDPFYWITAETALVPTSMVMILHIPSGLLLVIVPILTTFKSKTTRWPALFISIGGLLFGLVGFSLSLATSGYLAMIELTTGVPADWALFVIFGLFPIFLLFAGLAWALGTLIPSLWNFEIPGVEFEERA
jgi:hypothetical protein